MRELVLYCTLCEAEIALIDGIIQRCPCQVDPLVTYAVNMVSHSIRDATGSTEPNPGVPPQNEVFPGDLPQSAPAPIEPGPEE